MAERQDVRLGRKSLAALISELEKMAWSQLQQLLFKHNLDGRFAGPNKLAALGRVFHPLARPDADEGEVRLAQGVLEEISQGLHRAMRADFSGGIAASSAHAEERYRVLQQVLRDGGLELIDGRIAARTSSILESLSSDRVNIKGPVAVGPGERIEPEARQPVNPLGRGRASGGVGDRTDSPKDELMAGESPVNVRTVVFVCHASEDKDEFVRPLAISLQEQGVTVWYDEFTLRLGDSLRRSIDKGLAQADFGVVVLSPAFFEKDWPQYELDGLVQRETQGRKVVLPVWHNVSRADVERYSPALAGRVAARSTLGVEAVVREILEAVSSAQHGEIQTDTPAALRRSAKQADEMEARAVGQTARRERLVQFIGEGNELFERARYKGGASEAPEPIWDAAKDWLSRVETCIKENFDVGTHYTPLHTAALRAFPPDRARASREELAAFVNVLIDRLQSYVDTSA